MGRHDEIIEGGPGKSAAVARNREGRSDGSLLSMASSEHDEVSAVAVIDPPPDGDSGLGQTSRHSSKLSLTERKSQDGAEWDPLGEPPLGAAPLSHSAARHKIAVRPRRTTGPTRHRRLQQLSSASVLPSTPEMNEDVVGSSSGYVMTKSHSETLQVFSNSTSRTVSSSVVVETSSATAATSPTPPPQHSRQQEKILGMRSSVRPSSPSPTPSPSTKLSRSKSTGADRKMRHEVERFYENKRPEVDAKSTPLRHVSPPKRTPVFEDDPPGAEETPVSSSSIVAAAFGRESRRRDLRRIKKEKEDKKNSSFGRQNHSKSPSDDAVNGGSESHSFFGRLLPSNFRRSFKKKKDDGKHGDENVGTDDDEGGFVPNALSKPRSESQPPRRFSSTSVSPQRRMDPKGGYAQDTDTKFVRPEAYALLPPSAETGAANKTHTVRMPRSFTRSESDSTKPAADYSNKDVQQKPSPDTSNKGEDSVVIQPDVIHKTPTADPKPHFMVGSARRRTSTQEEQVNDELETKWQLRKSHHSIEKLMEQTSPPVAVMRPKTKDAPSSSPKSNSGEESTENRRQSLFVHLRRTGFFDVTQNGVNNGDSGPMSLDSVLTSRTDDETATAEDSCSSGSGTSFTSNGPVSLLVMPATRPVPAKRASIMPRGRNEDDDDSAEDLRAVKEPEIKPKVWECKVRAFERHQLKHSSSSSSSTSSSSTVSTTSSSPSLLTKGPPPAPILGVMETDLDDDAMETDPIVASFIGPRPTFNPNSGTAITTRPKLVAMSTADDQAASTTSSPGSRTVIKIGESRKNPASKIPVLSSAAPTAPASTLAPTTISPPTSSSLVAAVSKPTTLNIDGSIVEMRTKPPVPEAPFNRASWRPASTSAAGTPATSPATLAPPDSQQTQANELLKVFQRRSLKAKDAENLQAQVIELLDKDKVKEKTLEPVKQTPEILEIMNSSPEKPKAFPFKPETALTNNNNNNTNNNNNVLNNRNSSGAAQNNLINNFVNNNTKMNMMSVGQNGSSQNDSSIPEWKRIAQLRKEQREQKEQLTKDLDAESAGKNAAARSSKVLDLVNNFQKRVADPPTTSNL
ncbi:unnamed protein product [Notodromas monacha]|uniref:Uncharacterized protein n=1 Tax=Notodromas monacha TaxID=399045 RepID=A0A7R9BNX0_9CRUS|nr:unnamed protein product [Notodromas monacha]CAG0918989.1 unnamed protein product [Notodromas monacha]